MNINKILPKVDSVEQSSEKKVIVAFFKKKPVHL